MEINRIHSYPKIYALGHSAIADLLAEDVLVEEKIDGSQFSFQIQSGEVTMRSRGAVVYKESPGMFALAVSSVQQLIPLLHEGWVYRAEYLMKPKHNVMVYQRVPKLNLILFDVNTGDEVYLSRKEKEEEASRIGLEIVPVIYEGRIAKTEEIYALLKRDSIFGGGKIEGLVIKNYARFGLDKKVLMGKYVSEEFKETHNKEWKLSNPTTGDVIQKITETLHSEARWNKSLQRLRDAGMLENSPRDIGLLIKEVQQDIKTEELDFISTKLLEYALPKIIRGATHGLPEWYKRILLESAFNDN